MSKPWIHAVSSAKQWGGRPEDYLAIHEFLDSSKATIADSRHRALTHNSWFISFVLPKVFGDVFENSDNRTVSVRNVAEQHILEDFAKRFIPSAQDYLQEISYKEWMRCGKGVPPSFAKMESTCKTRKVAL